MPEQHPLPPPGDTPTAPAPQHCPSPRELDDLQLLAHGALGLRGFEGPGGLVTLQVPTTVAAAARDAGSLELVDPEGVPLATVTVQETYDAGAGLTGIQGPVTPLAHHEFGAFRRLYETPTQVSQRYDADTLTVPVAGPLSQEDLDEITKQAGDHAVLLLALAGHGTPRTPDGAKLDAPTLIRATLRAAELLDNAGVVAVPLATRDDARMQQQLKERVTTAYAPGRTHQPQHQGRIPDSITTALGRKSTNEQGLVVFFTGLSGSGKSTLARALHDVILERGERTVTSLDGDVVRRHLSKGLTFSKEDRETNIARIGWVAAEIARHGGLAICSPIAPFDATRKLVRGMVDDAGGAFVLVHVATPLEECERRDRKGLYAKARLGQIPEFTGISSPYEEPDDATVRVDTTGRSIEDVLADVESVLYDGGWLAR